MLVLRLFCVLSLLVIFPLATAHSADINEEGAEHLKTMFADMIEHQQSAMSLGETLALQADGDITVEPSDTYYAVTLPHMKVIYPDSRALEIGIISINAVPDDKPDQWKMTIALPTPMIVFNPEGEQVTRIHIGSQQAASLWHEKFQHFYKLDAAYNDIHIESAEFDTTTDISGIHIRYDLEEDENKRLSGPGTIRLSDLKASTPKGAVSIGEIKAEIALDRYDPAFTKQYREQITAIAQNSDNKEMSSEHAMALYNTLFDMIMKSGNGFTSNYSISNLEITDEDSPFSIDYALLGIDMTGFLDNAVDIITRIKLKDFKSKSDATYNGLAPNDINIDLRMNDIPFKQISDLGKNTLQGAIHQPEMAQLAGLSFVMKLPALMAQAGTYMEIKDNYVAGDDFKITLDGTAKADISAVNSATIDANSTFQGLDTVLERVKALTLKPDNEEEETKLDGTIKQLELLKSIGRPEGDTYHYKLIMDPQGKILLNDQDIFEVMQSKPQPQ